MFAPTYILWKHLANKYGESEPSAFPNYVNLPPNIKFNIALQSDFKTLENACMTYSEYQNMCNDDYFWKEKTYYDFGDLYNIEEIEYKWRDNYQRYRRRFTKEFIDTIKNKNLYEIDRLLNINNERQFLIVDGQDNKGRTPLILAVIYTFHLPRVVKKLLFLGADPDIQDERGWTALMLASMGGHTETVRDLIKAGANPNIKDTYGWTAFMLAFRNNYTKIFQMLLEAGADPDIQALHGKTALINASIYLSVKKARELLEAGANPNIKDTYGWTALMYTSMYGRTKIARALLEAGADPNIQNNDGVTALMYASNENHTEIVDLINDYNSFINRFRRVGNKFLRVGEEVADIYGGYGDY